MKLAGLSLIGGRSGNRGGKTFTGINPADGAPLPVEFHSASASDVEMAAKLADESFAAVSQWSGAKRLALLNRIAELLESGAAEIVERGNLETALPVARLQGELARTCFQLRQYGQAAASGLCAGARIDHADPGRKPQPKPDLRSMLVPLGPVVVFGASNFPLAYSVAGGDTASALAAGCPVIVKAHPAHPGTSELVGRLIQQAAQDCGAPEGIFSMLFDAGIEVGVALVKHPLVRAVGFTGSRRGGRALMDLAAARPEPIPVYAEMSSVNPVFILKGALAGRAEEIATGLHGSVTMGVGQFCTCPGLVFIESGAGAKKFLTKLENMTSATPSAVMLTKGICSNYRAGVAKFANTPGVRIFAQANAVGHDDSTRAGASLFATDAKNFMSKPALMEEVFGPSTLIVECDSPAEMLAAATKIEGQLTATLHATPEELAANQSLVNSVAAKAGRIVFNGFPTGVEVTHAMTHGGPYPATSDGRSTSVGTRAIERFLRPVSYQNFPDTALPPELQEANPLRITRLCDGVLKAVCLWLLALLLTASTAMAETADVPREHLSLDANWKFHLGDDWPNALALDKAGGSSGPASAKFSDQTWRTLDLPHDWAIELPFDSKADGSHGFKPVGPGFLHNSVGWYRRTFELPGEDAGKRIWLTFDGVFRDATVWVNGWLITRHESGYYPFREDITDVVKFGGKNVISVRVDASKFEGWFYEGAGIYRHVWLDKTAPVAIAPGGIFVYSKFSNNVPEGPVMVQLRATLINRQQNRAAAEVDWRIFDPNGKAQAGGVHETSEIAPGGRTEYNREIGFDSPILWSPENPKLYKLITTVEVGGKVVDQNETTFGIRTVAFDPDKGFLLNGKPYELKGTCNHQDMAGVGAALPDALQYFRIKKLKEFGCNAYRTSHNPPTPELLDACDRLGMIVMDENRLLGSDSQNMARWKAEILRDRNHPSVCIWSIANEEFYEQSTPQGANVARAMQDLVKQLDPARPVTYAAPQGDTFEGINGVIEVRGWNYHVGQDMDKYHAEHPNQPNVGTEQASTVSTRGIYANDKQRGYVSAYDDNFPGWASTAENWWSYFAGRPWLSGGFVWTGFDYRGEPTPYSWPCINSHFGILDTCGFPKDNFYYYQSWWTTNTVLHLLPHWNWRGREGQGIRVDALSNCKEVELFLNGNSLGRQTMKPNSKLTWQVKYEPGTLSAKGYDASGNVIARTKEETTGEPAAIQLTPDRSAINADGEDVSVFTVSAMDAQGREVPTAQNLIHFELTGAGKILGVGNGDPSCHEPDTYVPQLPVHAVSVNGWRWKLASFPIKRGETVPEFALEYDDSSWNTIKPKTDGDTGDMFLKPGQTAIYRAHVKLTEADLDNPAVQIRFAGCDDNGWYFVNDQRVGESHDWQSQPVFDIKKYLHAGDNLIAVGVKNDDGEGGLNPDVNVEIVGKPAASPWSRSLFNGLAQVIVQSTKDAGEIKLKASAEGLKPVTCTITTQPCTPRPAMP